MEKLHTDIVQNILFRLPAEAALQAKRVCITWEALLRNYKFDKPGYLFAIRESWSDEHVHLFYGDEYDHYDHAKMNYYHTRDTLVKMEAHRFTLECMVGSSNGLVCFGKMNEEYHRLVSYQICNPLTGEYVLLPINPDQLRHKWCMATDVDGFGYCHSTKEYKVVRLYRKHRHEDYTYVQVYTVGGKWRDIEQPIRCGTFLRSPGVCANGALYWFHINRATTVCLKDYEILAFDLEHEKFYSIPLPDDGIHYHSNIESHFKLLGDGNCFYLVYERTRCIAIWALKRNNCSSDMQSWSWIKEFNVKCEWGNPYTEAFAVTRNNDVLLWYGGKILHCYDPKTSTTEKLWDDNMMGCSNIMSIPHIHSIVSLKDLGETDVRSYKTSVSPTTTKKRKAEDGEESIFP